MTTAMKNLGAVALAASLLALVAGCGTDPAADTGPAGPGATPTDGADAGAWRGGSGASQADATQSGGAQDGSNAGTSDIPPTSGASDAGGAGGAGGGTDTSAPTPDGGGIPTGPETVNPGGGGSGELPIGELYLKILGPPSGHHGRRHAAVLSAVTPIGGIVFGTPDSIEWTTDGGESGAASGSPFWQSDAIVLKPGPNRITVTAIRGEETATDSMVVIYTPQFLFDSRPRVSPDQAFVGDAISAVVSVPMTLFTGFDANSVKVWRVDANGEKLNQSPLGSLKDNGQLAGSCDDIEQDGVFSTCLSGLSCTPDGDIWLAVSVQVDTGTSTYEAMSEPVRIECATRITQADCAAALKTNKDALSKYSEAGGAEASAAGRDAAISWLKAQSNVADAGPSSGDGYGVWIRFKAGFLGGLSLNPGGVRGSGAARAAASAIGRAAARAELNTTYIDSKKVLVVSPYSYDFSASGGDEGPALASLFAGSQCPSFSVAGPHKGGAADLATLRRQEEYGVVIFTTHGDALFQGMDPAVKESFEWEHAGSQEVLWSGGTVNCNALSSFQTSCNINSTSDCPAGQVCMLAGSGGSSNGICVDRTQMDLARGRVIMGHDTWGITPTFVARHHTRQLPKSMVYLGACRSIYNGTMAAEYFAAGASAVAGYSGYVTNQFASTSGMRFFESMLTNKEKSGTAKFAVDPNTDDTPDLARFRLFGAANLDITDAQLINPSFETADLTGWGADGDGRVIAKLGQALPVQGKFMGIISTGLGFTEQTGEISQTFCVPPDKTHMRFYWKFYSEEFKEWCGSQYQDTFQATLAGAQGQLTLVSAKVDNLCHYDDGSCSPCPDPGVGNCQCGSNYVGLVASDVSFDKGGVYNIQWQLHEADITPFSGAGPVELKFFSTDQGDSIFDTVILIDAITFD